MPLDDGLPGAAVRTPQQITNSERALPSTQHVRAAGHRRSVPNTVHAAVPLQASSYLAQVFSATNAPTNRPKIEIGKESASAVHRPTRSAVERIHQLTATAPNGIAKNTHVSGVKLLVRISNTAP